MLQTQFDHERLDVYRLSIEYSAFAFGIASQMPSSHKNLKEQWLRASQSIPLNIAEANGKSSLKSRCNFFDIARGSAFECSAIQDIFIACQSQTTEELNPGKKLLIRIVSMLTKIARRGQNDSVPEHETVF